MKYLSFSYVCHYIYIYIYMCVYQIYVTAANYLYHKLLVLWAQLSGYSQVTPWVGSLTAHVISIYQLIWRASTETVLLQNPYRTSGCLMSSGWLGWGSPKSEKQMGALPIQACRVLSYVVLVWETPFPAIRAVLCLLMESGLTIMFVWPD